MKDDRGLKRVEIHFHENCAYLESYLKLCLSRVTRTAQSSNDFERFWRENTFVFLSMNNICAQPYVYSIISRPEGISSCEEKREKERERRI